MKRIGIPSLVAGLLCLAVFTLLLFSQRRAAAAGLVLGYVVSLAYFLSLRRGVLGSDSALRLKLLAALRFFLIGLVLLALGFFLPSGLWGFLAAFSLVFFAFILESMRR